MSKRMLITGNFGYIGSVMAPYFLEHGYQVTGLDTGYFASCVLGKAPRGVKTIQKDIRDVSARDLEGFDAVIHLAALSNDPIGNLSADWTEQINFQASVSVARLAREAGVSRFLFSSSCVMYGMSEAAIATEDSPLDPRTEYARSKVKAEEEIRKLACPGFSPVFLRNGTIYGYSPRMRFDTVLNDLVASALTTGKVVLHSNGLPWRPVVHVEDVARSFHHVLEAPVEKIHNQVFNNGSQDLNHQVFELAQFAAQAVPGSEVEIRAESGADQRTYKADFTKFKTAFPTFRFKWTARTGAEELAEAYRRVGLKESDYSGLKYVRLRWLRSLIDAGKLDGSLRWQVAPVGKR